MSNAVYNELDSYPAAWLRNLIAAGQIDSGEVRECSIKDLRPEDVQGRDFHAFAGIGVWAYALRAAGWSGPVWTGSCPCQPFSSAGRGAGFADERHLWPVWFELIRACRPPVVFGEQVASKDGLAWLDLVYADLEGEGYTVRAVDICAAGVGAPHIRQRLYFVAYTDAPGLGFERSQGLRGHEQAPRRADADGRGSDGGVADVSSSGWGEGRQAPSPDGTGSSDDGWLGDAVRERDADDGSGSADPATAGMQGSDGERERIRPDSRQSGDDVLACGVADDDEGGCRSEFGDVPEGQSDLERRGPVNGYWAGAEWIPCYDGKFRPTEPGTFPLAHGTPGRVGKLRAYGNALVASCAIEFIRAAQECLRG